MAGISIEIQRLMRSGGLLGQVQAYAYAAAVGSGPWVLSIFALLLVGLWVPRTPGRSLFVDDFQVCVTYMMAASLVLTGGLQLAFARFVADKLYQGQDEAVLPNLQGALLLAIGVSGTLGAAVLALAFDGSMLYRQLLLAGFVCLCAIWVVVVFASAIQAWRQVLVAFLVGYGLTTAGALALQGLGIEGMLLAFDLGQGVLLFLLLARVARQYPSARPLAFDFLRKPQLVRSLLVTGTLYGIGIWADKLVFWFDAGTGVPVRGPLRASPIYDLPIFLSYLSLVPGMAVFLVRVEIDFARSCAAFIRAIEGGGSLAQVMQAKAAVVASVHGALADVGLVQAVTAISLMAFAPEILAAFGISPMYRMLLCVDLLAVAVQMVVMVVLSILFYLDEPRAALQICAVFALANLVLSWATLQAGPAFYGYGFALAGLVTALLGLRLLSQKLQRLEFRTFMLQPVAY